MNWADLAQTVSKVAPLLGSLLGGPAGGAVGGIIASALGTGGTPQDISEALANPETLVKLKQIEADKIVKLQELIEDQAKAELVAVTQSTSDVNKTMQSEAASEHWPTYSWRPAIGFSVAFAIVCSVLTVFLAYGAAIIYGKVEGLAQLPGILAAVMGIVGVASPILGIASYFRGKAQADPNIPTSNKG